MFRSLLKFFIIVPVILYIILCIILYVFQGDLLFFPRLPNSRHYESLLQNHNLKNLQLSTVDGNMLDGWMQTASGKQFTILYFGGNAEETSYFPENYRYNNANIMNFNYRGYGRSTGIPGEGPLFLDSLLQYDYMVNSLGIPSENIIIMGRSIGTGIATYLASQRKVHSVILITPYDSIESVAKENYPIFPVSILLKNKFNSLDFSYLQKNKLLCIYGGNDTVIPNYHTENLLIHWRGDITKIFIPTADHNSIFSFPELENAINSFIPQ